MADHAPLPSTRVPCLDGLRAISVLAVIFSHCEGTFSKKEFPIAAKFFALWPTADLGVRTFFVISGFIITTLLLKESVDSGQIQIGGFYKRRIRRIFPAFYSYLTVMLVAVLTGKLLLTTAQLASAATFTVNYSVFWDHVGGDAYWFIGHFWTLSLEEQFYLIWPGLLVLAGINKTRWFAVGAVLLSPFVRTLSYFVFPKIRGELTMMFHSGMDPIMTGCLLAMFSNKPGVYEKYLSRLKNSKMTPFLSLLFLMIISPALTARFKGAYALPIGISAESLAIASLIYWLINNRNSLISRLLNTRVLVHIGTISYGLYLWQQPFFSNSVNSVFFRFPLNLLSCLVVAEISYFLIERPFLIRNRGLPFPSNDQDVIGQATAVIDLRIPSRKSI